MQAESAAQQRIGSTLRLSMHNGSGMCITLTRPAVSDLTAYKQLHSALRVGTSTPFRFKYFP